MVRLQIIIMDETGKVLGRMESALNGETAPAKDPIPEEKMSDAQRRYLFRLLSDMGIEGERARAAIKEKLAVGDVKDVSKSQASYLIERLKSQIDSAKRQAREV